MCVCERVPACDRQAVKFTPSSTNYNDSMMVPFTHVYAWIYWQSTEHRNYSVHKGICVDVSSAKNH